MKLASKETQAAAFGVFPGKDIGQIDRWHVQTSGHGTVYIESKNVSLFDSTVAFALSILHDSRNKTNCPCGCVTCAEVFQSKAKARAHELM